MNGALVRRRTAVPVIVYIVLTQATRKRAEGGITSGSFAEQIQRISREELLPKGMKLLVRELPGGRTRFIIKEQATDAVCDLLEFDVNGAPEGDSVELMDSSVRRRLCGMSPL